MKKYKIVFIKDYKKYYIRVERKRWFFWGNIKYLVVSGNNQDAVYREAWSECLGLAEYYNIDLKDIIIK